MAIERYTPSSTAIRRTVYAPGSQRLAVQFRSGKRYVYNGVSRQRMAAFRKASSAGAFLNASIKKNLKVKALGSGPGILRKALGVRKRKGLARNGGVRGGGRGGSAGS